MLILNTGRIYYKMGEEQVTLIRHMSIVRLFDFFNLGYSRLMKCKHGA